MCDEHVPWRSSFNSVNFLRANRWKFICRKTLYSDSLSVRVYRVFLSKRTGSKLVIHDVPSFLRLLLLGFREISSAKSREKLAHRLTIFVPYEKDSAIIFIRSA